MYSKDVGDSMLHFSSVTLAQLSASLSCSVLRYNRGITVLTLEVLLGFSTTVSICDVPDTIDIHYVLLGSLEFRQEGDH